MDNKKGFTLLEIIVSIGLFSLILVTFLSFSIKKDERAILEQNVHKLANDIRFAKEYARTQNMGFDFVIDVVNNEYYLRRGSNVVIREQLPKEYGIYYTGFKNQFYINNLGRIKENSRITIINTNGEIGMIVMSVSTGRVRVEMDD